MVVNQLLKYGEFGIVLFDNFQVTERTRNQFVDNTTRGFESLPLRQKNRDPTRESLFFDTTEVDSHPATNVAGFAYAAKHVSSLLVNCKRAYLRDSEYPSVETPPWDAHFFGATGEDSRPATNVLRIAARDVVRDNCSAFYLRQISSPRQARYR